ncbi:DnaJ domain-containing protein [Candidatus Sumerlaeota bacterium]|nr:DnaJ domain-containing protein [Candidatus Sumerlaeota bacterium]
MNKTYYEILGIEAGATEKEVKQAYRKLARELHPDKAKDVKERQEKEKIFADISKAYNLLKDRDKREEYDQKLKVEEKAGAGGAGTVQGESQTKAERKGISKEREMIARKAFLKGMQILKNRDFSGAITFFQAAIENDDNEAVYYYRIAMAMMMAKKGFSKAVEYANEAIKRDPYNFDYKLLLGEIYEKAGGITKAVKIYEDILRWDKTHLKATENLVRLGYSPEGKETRSFFGKLIKKIRGK